MSFYGNDNNDNGVSFGQNLGNYNSGSNGGESYDNGSSAGGDQSYSGYSPQEPAPFNVQSVQLPPPQMGCYQPPGQMKGQVQHRKGQETNETKNCELTFNDTKTATRDNVIHHQHVKNVLINVNRNHNHLIKLCNRDSNHHHHLINNIVRVNDIHNQKIEEVRGEGRTTRDYKQTSRVEAGTCRRGTTDGGSGFSSGGNGGNGGNYSSGSANYSSSSQNYSSGSQNYSSGSHNYSSGSNNYSSGSNHVSFAAGGNGGFNDNNNGGFNGNSGGIY